MMRKFICLLFPLLLVSCTQEIHTITGKIENVKGTINLKLEKLSPTDLEIVDSCKVNEDGEFYFDYQVNDIGLYRVTESNNNSVIIVLKKDDRINFKSDINNLNTYKADGSLETLANTKLSEILNKSNPKTDSLRMVYQKVIGTADEQVVLIRIRDAYEKIMDIQKEEVKGFIDSNLGNFTTILAVMQLGEIAEYFEYYSKVMNSLEEKHPDNEWVLDLKQNISKISNTKIGAIAPEFTINDENGNPKSLESFRGSVVLIDFWASWCKPCRKENPNVVAVYNKYKSEGLEIIGISLDDTTRQTNAKQQWLNAIKEDNITWTQLSQLQGFNSPIVSKYGVNSIPATFLLDENGVIIARNLRGTQLENKISEIFE
jgi:peroxiredoxin